MELDVARRVGAPANRRAAPQALPSVAGTVFYGSLSPFRAISGVIYREIPLSESNQESWAGSQRIASEMDVAPHE
jgi:hypothetical protein